MYIYVDDRIDQLSPQCCRRHRVADITGSATRLLPASHEVYKERRMKKKKQEKTATWCVKADSSREEQQRFSRYGAQ